MSYPHVIDFGKAADSSIANNPLTYCMFPTVNSQFTHGSTSANLLYSPVSPACQNYMANRCSKEWDGFCEAYNVINVDRAAPNSAAVDTLAQQFANAFQDFRPTAGDNLLRNVVHARFIHFKHLSETTQPFDPNVANSPMISFSNPYVYEGSTVINAASPASIDADPNTDLLLRHPSACFDVLARIYLAHLRHEEGVDIVGSKLEGFFKRNSYTLDRFLRQAVHKLLSFK